MRAGRLRHRPMVQRQVTEQDEATGEMVDSYVDVRPVWARVEPLSARDLLAAQAAGSEVSVRVTIRPTDVRAHDRLVHRGKYLHVIGVLPDNESGLEYLTLTCSEGARKWPMESDST